MTKRDDYRAILNTLSDWEPYLREHSGLPGPRGNLELIQAAADAGDPPRFEALLRYGPDIAPTNTPDEFLACCGVLGLGKLIAGGQPEHFARLRAWASDPRWRLREAVAMALQRVGSACMPALLSELAGWCDGGWLEQRAVVAGLAEPVLLLQPEYNLQALDLFDRMTANLQRAADRSAPEFKVLRQALGYGWSVLVAAQPVPGKARFAAWLDCPDPDLRWLLRENLSKKRLVKLDLVWVSATLARLKRAAEESIIE